MIRTQYGDAPAAFRSERVVFGPAIPCQEAPGTYIGQPSGRKPASDAEGWDGARRAA